MIKVIQHFEDLGWKFIANLYYYIQFKSPRMESWSSTRLSKTQLEEAGIEWLENKEREAVKDELIESKVKQFEQLLRSTISEMENINVIKTSED